MFSFPLRASGHVCTPADSLLYCIAYPTPHYTTLHLGNRVPYTVVIGHGHSLFLFSSHCYAPLALYCEARRRISIASAADKLPSAFALWTKRKKEREIAFYLFYFLCASTAVSVIFINCTCRLIITYYPRLSSSMDR